MVARFTYSVVRCLPVPRTGEFLNAAVLVGDSVSARWIVRSPRSAVHLKKLVSEVQVRVVHEFVHTLERTVAQNSGQYDTRSTLLGVDWLHRLRADHQNFIQLSEPATVSAWSIEEAADLLQSQLLTEPERTVNRTSITRRTLQAELHEQYRLTVPAPLIHSKVTLVVGDWKGQDFDFAIGNGHVVQLAQTISFRVAAIGKVKTEVEALGYNLSRLRRGLDAHLVDSHGNRLSEVTDPKVEVAALVALPRSDEQEVVYGQAHNILSDLDVQVATQEQAGTVGTRARLLVERDFKEPEDGESWPTLKGLFGREFASGR